MRKEEAEAIVARAFPFLLLCIYRPSSLACLPRPVKLKNILAWLNSNLLYDAVDI